jgi:hypothetical protein
MHSCVSGLPVSRDLLRHWPQCASPYTAVETGSKLAVNMHASHHYNSFVAPYRIAQVSQPRLLSCRFFSKYTLGAVAVYVCFAAAASYRW